jgi:hypothetical protein
MENRVKRNTKHVGDIAESAVINALIKCGYEVSIPFGENHRYDAIVDKDGVLSRIQIKSGRLRRGVIDYAACSSHSHRGGLNSRSYRGEVEYFGVYCRETDSVYLVPCADAPATRGSLRIDPTKQGQSKKVRWAQPYLLCRGTPVLVGRASKAVVRALDPVQLEMPS